MSAGSEGSLLSAVAGASGEAFASALASVARAVLKSVPGEAVASLVFSTSRPWSRALPAVLPLAATRLPVSTLPAAVRSTPAVFRVPTTAVTAASALAWVSAAAAVASKLPKKLAGAVALRLASTSSLTGVMLALAALPLPVATECSSVPSAAVTRSTQGSWPPGKAME